MEKLAVDSTANVEDNEDKDKNVNDTNTDKSANNLSTLTTGDTVNAQQSMEDAAKYDDSLEQCIPVHEHTEDFTCALSIPCLDRGVVSTSTDHASYAHSIGNGQDDSVPKPSKGNKGKARADDKRSD